MHTKLVSELWNAFVIVDLLYLYVSIEGVERNVFEW